MFTVVCATTGHASSQTALDPYAAAIKNFDAKTGGLLPVYLDDKGGRVLITLKPTGRPGGLGEFLYQVYLRSGLGSTPIGLDRSEPADTQLIAFRRAGTMVYAELVNTAFRADGGSDAEKSAVHDSFPASTIWSTLVVAEGAGGAVLRCGGGQRRVFPRKRLARASYVPVLSLLAFGHANG
jgi:hypothetical protein